MQTLTDIRCFLMDMDGTFYLGDRLLPGALKFVELLKQSERDYLFLTNNSSRSASYYAAKLNRLGCPAAPADILTSGEATALYIKQRKPWARIYLLGTPELTCEFLQHGFTLTASQPDYVVLGFDTTLTYEKLATACQLIRGGVPFIATHPDFNCPTEDGYIPDCGSMIELIKASTGTKPYVIGKPNRDIVEVLFAKKNYQPHEMAIIGDRLYTDIATGCNAGIKTILVLSGETNSSDVETSTIKPDYIFENIGVLADTLSRLSGVKNVAGQACAVV